MLKIRDLLSRATERVQELPLALNENQQYIHYNKGSVVFYALKDAIGEDAFNHILSGFLDKWAFKGPPYPTTRDFLADLYAGTDQKYHPLIRDMFERIVFFDNRAVELIVDEEPYEAGIDPYNKLVDRSSGDNRKRVTVR